MMQKHNGNSFSNTFEDFYYIVGFFFSLSVVYRINSKLIFYDQKKFIKMWSKPLMYFTSFFDNNASTLLSLFQAKTIWYLLIKNHQVHPTGDKLLPEIHTSTQSTRNLVGLKVNHEKSM
jgi:hypothetical protein